MGINVEFNPYLALRNFSEFKLSNRKEEECFPEILEAGKIYPFLKEGQRNYWLLGEIPLIETKGNGILSRPRASIIILEAVHFLEKGKLFTRGKYLIVEVFKDNEVYFEGLDRMGSRKF